MASDKRKTQTKSPSTPVAAKGNNLPVKMDTPSKKNGVKAEQIKAEPMPQPPVQNPMPPQTPQQAMHIQHTSPTNQYATPPNRHPAPINQHVAPVNVEQNIHQMMSKLVPHVLKENPTLIPTDPTKQPITSGHINAVAHAMWQIAFRHGGMLQRASQYGSMFSPLKLSALARLNYLPSWWYLRSLVVTNFREPEKSWWVDDREEEEVWEETLRWCVKLLEKRSEKEGGEGAKECVKGEKDHDKMEE